MTTSTLVFHANGNDYAVDFETQEDALNWFGVLQPHDASVATKITAGEADAILGRGEDEYDEAEDSELDEPADGEI